MQLKWKRIKIYAHIPTTNTHNALITKLENKVQILWIIFVEHCWFYLLTFSKCRHKGMSVFEIGYIIQISQKKRER